MRPTFAKCKVVKDWHIPSAAENDEFHESHVICTVEDKFGYQFRVAWSPTEDPDWTNWAEGKELATGAWAAGWSGNDPTEGIDERLYEMFECFEEDQEWDFDE